MTSDMQREAVAALAEVWSLSPDIRLGKLLAHLGLLDEAHLGRRLGYIDDDELLAILYRPTAELMERLEGAPNFSPHRIGAATSVSGSPTLLAAAPAAEIGR
jgi:hypothetical protein